MTNEYVSDVAYATRYYALWQSGLRRFIQEGGGDRLTTDEVAACLGRWAHGARHLSERSMRLHGGVHAYWLLTATALHKEKRRALREIQRAVSAEG